MLIGLVAPSGTGKSAVAKHLQKAHGFKRYHAGEPLKRAFRKGFGLSKAEVGGDKAIDDPARKLGGVEARTVMDAASDAVHRTAPKATAFALGAKLDRAPRGRDVVVDGVRSSHEADAIRRRGGVIVRVRRDGHDPDPALAMDRLQAAVNADHTIVHPGDKAGLKANTDELVRRLAVP